MLISHVVSKHFPAENLSVLAGHFSWDIWNVLPFYHFLGNLTPASQLPSILVINRHPIERVISYFYQRCYDVPHCNSEGKLLRDWNDVELEKLILSYRAWYVDEDLQRLAYSLQRKYETIANSSLEYDGAEFEIVRRMNGDRKVEIVVIDDGMSDAACRAILNKKITTDIRLVVSDGSHVLPSPIPLTDVDIQEALRRIDHCVVGLQEHWEESIRVINFFFPWINFMNRFDYVKMPSSHRSLDSRASLPDKLLSIIETHNKCDFALYAKMRTVFAKQQELLFGEFV